MVIGSSFLFWSNVFGGRSATVSHALYSIIFEELVTYIYSVSWMGGMGEQYNTPFFVHFEACRTALWSVSFEGLDLYFLSCWGLLL